MVNTLTDGERDILAELNRDAEQGLCPSCGHFYPASEYAQDWRGVLPDERLETQDGNLIPLAKCCTDCVDGFFADDTCAHVTADGSMEYC
ncbi:hypothetical protein [Armatimonas sp.]|uniref:hypothetical protein n=1 Tax=Armatimonas sp. TaxID=1872638 RepID=UPI003750B46F